jgi:hypothetical protein
MTAVEYLSYVYALQGAIYQDDIDKAIEMEKEQIIEAFAKGSDEESDYHGFQFITPDKAIEYYNETFKQQDQ